MKTTLDLPDEVMIAAKIRAARERLPLKDVVANALRKDLGMYDHGTEARISIRDIEPVSVGVMLRERPDFTEDRMEDMLDARGRRY